MSTARKLTPTTYAIRELEARGYLAGIVERKVSRLVTHDLFGFADIVAVGDCGTLGLQVTDYSSTSKRVEKLLAEQNVLHCLLNGWAVEVWGRNPKPTRDGWWRCRSLVLRDGEIVVSKVSETIDFEKPGL